MDTKQIEALRNRFGGSGSFPATYDDLTDLCDAVLAVLAPAASEPAPHIPLRTHTSLGPGEILIGSAADAVRIVNVAEPVRKSFICNASVRCKGGTVIAPCVLRPGHDGDHCAEPRLPAPVEPAREAFPPGRGWRCEACGEMAEDVPDTAWRWAGDRYQHSHGQAGHFDARFFGEPAREAKPTACPHCKHPDERHNSEGCLLCDCAIADGDLNHRRELDALYARLAAVTRGKEVYQTAYNQIYDESEELQKELADLRARLAQYERAARRGQKGGTVTDERMAALVAAFRTIDRLHNLGSAIYSVRERVDCSDLPENVSSWEHPDVGAYGAAVKCAREIVAGFDDTTAQEPERCDGSGVGGVLTNHPACPDVPCTGTGCHPVEPARLDPNAVYGPAADNARKPDFAELERRGHEIAAKIREEFSPHFRLTSGDMNTRLDAAEPVVPAPTPFKFGDWVRAYNEVAGVVVEGVAHRVRFGDAEPYGYEYVPVANLRRIVLEKETTHDDHDTDMDSVDATGCAPDVPTGPVPDGAGNASEVTDDTPARGEAEPTCSYCHGVGACPRCWGRAAITEKSRELDDLRARLDRETRRADEFERRIEREATLRGEAVRECEDLRTRLAQAHTDLPAHRIALKNATERLAAAEREIAAWKRCAGIVVMAADGCDPDDRTPDALPRLVAERITREEKRAGAAERERDEASAGWADDRRKLLASDRRVEELTAALSVISHLIPCKEPCPPLTRCLTCGHERGGPCAGCIARAALAAALAKKTEG